MPKNIKTVHDQINFALAKGLHGYFSPEQIDNWVYAQVMNLWKKYLLEYETTKKISLYLAPFEKTESVSGLLGLNEEGYKVVTSCHLYPVSLFVTTTKKPVEVLTLGEYINRYNNPNKGPTTDNPICRFENNTIYIAPKIDITAIYLSIPVKQKYAYTIQGDDYIYDDLNSIDLEFNPILHDEIVNRVLADLGINMRDNPLLQYSNNEKVTEGR